MQKKTSERVVCTCMHVIGLSKGRAEGGQRGKVAVSSRVRSRLLIHALDIGVDKAVGTSIQFLLLGGFFVGVGSNENTIRCEVGGTNQKLKNSNFPTSSGVMGSWVSTMSWDSLTGPSAAGS